VLSFVGFVPAEDPRLTMLVMLDEPKNEKWGSEAAAPIFASIGREALRYLNVPPRNTAPVALVRGEIGTAAPFIATAAALSFDGAAVELLSVGDDSATLMPRMQGLSLRQALEVLAPLDVRLEVTGRGIVVGQAPPPGAPLPAGAMCRLALASPAARP
jgi:cell division protein FtsI (penicillin-binding protein 3)